ncbi:MAG: hypothetical protein QNJ98_03215 [Planctomycetota bacterium]|nr:hypothetical protein [Planctomycetota bacterium]
MGDALDDTRYGYLELEGEVRGPYDGDELREQVDEAPDAAWRYSVHGVTFGPLPSQLGQSAASDRRPRTPVPLPVPRTWPDNGDWHRRTVTRGALAVFIGFWLPHVILAGERTQWVPMWSGLGRPGWHAYGLFALASLLLLGALLPLLLTRDANVGRRALRSTWVSGIALYVYALSDPPALGFGDLLFAGLFGPARLAMVPGTDAFAFPAGASFTVLLLLAGCVLIAAGTRVESRYLGRSVPLLSRAGGWIVLLTFVLPLREGSVAELVWLEPLGAEDEVPFSFVCLAVFALGAMGALAGRWPADRRVGCHARRLLIYIIAIGAPLAAYGGLAAHHGHGFALAAGLLRDVMVVYGVLSVVGCSLAAWALDAVPDQPRTAADGEPSLQQKRQSTLALCLALVAIAPRPDWATDELGRPVLEARWLFERVFDPFTEPGFGGPERPVTVLILMLLPLLSALALYLVSRRRSRRGAAVAALVILGVAICHGSTALTAGMGRYLPYAVELSILVGDPPGPIEEWAAISHLGPLASVALALLAAAALRARGEPPQSGWRHGVAIGAATLLAIGLIVPVGGSVSGLYLVAASAAGETWVWGAIGLAIAAFGAVGLRTARAHANEPHARALLARLLHFGLWLFAGLTILGLMLTAVDMAKQDAAGAEVTWIAGGRILVEDVLVTVLLVLWLDEAMRWFATTPHRQMEQVFE